MAVSQAQIEELLAKQEELEEVLGTFIGGYLGGPPGAVLGRGAVEVHQRSPSHWLEQEIARRAPAVIENFLDRRRNPTPRVAPKKRKASAYSKKYGKAFKQLAPKYKKKSGGWKKNGFKNCSCAARKVAKK